MGPSGSLPLASLYNMPDVVSPETRSRMMSGIRGKDTQPELRLRRALHHDGFRYRLHVKDLPGRPDIVFPRYKAAVFVHGCFWHGHLGCKYFKVPATRTDFWLTKIGANQMRDGNDRLCLESAGWRTCVVWECATRHELDATAAAVEGWLLAGDGRLDLAWR
jgi:DNA mismatch endonuclease (patch repair protein)